MLSVPYRHDIDGLRAIAVLSVLIYHAKFTLFSRNILEGGFLGVDIFFVISGYLISRILMKEIHTAGRINLRNFFGKRARRILPALLSVAIVTSPALYFFLLPDDLVDASASLLSALAFAANIFFIFETTEYAADISLLEPYLHTWSLGVEEQFYLVFPLMVIVVYYVRKTWLLPAIILCMFFSFVLNLDTTSHQSELNFFLPSTRFWELLSGSLIAYIHLFKPKNRFVSLTESNLIQIGFLVCIILFLLLAKNDELHPGPMTLLPILATVGLIASLNSETFIKRALSQPWLTYIGKISFSLYLWHFPLFALVRLGWGEPSIGVKIGLIAVSFLLAALSHRLVETPWRDLDRVSPRCFWLGVCSAVFTLIIFHGTVLAFDGFPKRMPSLLIPELSEHGYRSMSDGSRRCHSHPEGFCEFEIQADAPGTVLLVGDSHADSLANDLYARLKNSSIGRFVHMTVPGCPMSRDFAVIGRSTCTFEAQARRMELIQSYAEVDDLIIVYFARTPLFLSGERFRAASPFVEEAVDPAHEFVGTREEALLVGLTDLQGLGNLILVDPMPELGIHVNRHFNSFVSPGFPDKFRQSLREKPIQMPINYFLDRVESTWNLYNRLNGSSVRRISTHEIFCDSFVDARCVGNDDERIFYTDSNHPNHVGAALINSYVLSAVEDLRLR